MRALATIAFLTLSAGAPVSAQVFAAPEGQPARHARFDRRALVDCGAHGVFTPPTGWSAVRTDREIHLTSPDGRARLVRAHAHFRSATELGERVAAIASALLDAPAALEPVSETRHGRWRADRRVTGHGTRAGSAITIEARSDRDGDLWIAFFTSDATPADRAALDAAIGSWLRLVSHACECGFDCDRRPARSAT